MSIRFPQDPSDGGTNTLVRWAPTCAPDCDPTSGCGAIACALDEEPPADGGTVCGDDQGCDGEVDGGLGDDGGTLDGGVGDDGTLDGGVCVGVGEGSLGASCWDDFGCVPGLACFRHEDGGVCGKVCCGDDADECGAGMRCGGSGELVSGARPGYGECIPNLPCQLLGTPSGCGYREACYIVDPQGTTACRLAGESSLGESCTVQEDCGAGLFCAGLTASRCVQVCALGDLTGCPSELRCVVFAFTPTGFGLCTE